MISVGPVGPLWRCCWPVLPPLVPLISLESLLGGCKHSVSVPSVNIFERNHIDWFFNITGYTVPTLHNSLGVKIPPYVQSWCSRPNVQWVRRLPCNPLTVTCHCNCQSRLVFFSAGWREGRQVRAPVRGPGPAPAGDGHGPAAAAAHGRDSSHVPEIQGHV